MSIQKELILRYRSQGHIRFQLPKRLCHKAIARCLQEAIAGIDGVYRVHVYHRQGKLSIRYQEALCDFQSLVRQLSALLDEMEKKGQLRVDFAVAQSVAGGDSWLKKAFGNFRAGRWVQDKFTETRETAQAVGVLAKLGMKKKPALLKDPEKTLIDFFNDVLVLYLIKTHWHLITQHWITKPFRHRYEWLSVFYMMYLLLRSRNPRK